MQAVVETTDDVEMMEEYSRMTLQMQRVTRAIESINDDPSQWVFWKSKNQDDQDEYIARPLYSTSFTSFLFDSADVKIYMSAYPGDREAFCRSLGLPMDQVAWARFGSTFPVANRPIIIAGMGSMGQRSISETMPRMIKNVVKIAACHKNEKGLIHCVSYKLGKAIFDALEQAGLGRRLIYPKTADDREEAFEHHAHTLEPTIIISPSMMEGFDFAGNLARWQIIAKVAYPNLGDIHTQRRKELDPGWYAMETVKNVVQATGRIVRSIDDTGKTYILDSDISMLLSKNRAMFPTWWLNAVKTL